MAATRFYLPTTGTPPVSPAFDAGWEQTGQADRITMLPKGTLSTVGSVASNTITVPITTTQDLLCRQYVSNPIPPQRITGTVSGVFSPTEALAAANCKLAVVVKVVSQDGGTERGTLFSTFSTGTEFATTSTTNSRIVPVSAITELTTQPGDRLVIEVGANAAAPSSATSYNITFNTNKSSDLALTAGANGTLGNNWFEFSQDIFGTFLNNFQFVKAPDGISVSEKIR